MGDPSSVLGQTVGQYRIASFLGAGGMAEVFIGEHTAIGRQVAIKVLLAEMCQQPEVVERFMNEARALGRITHPNVVEIYDVGKLANGRVCIVMEMLRGEPLSRMLAQRGQLPIGEAVAVASQIAEAMAAAHDCKIIHRDLKPDNVFIAHDADGLRIKVLDFGVAKLIDGAGAVATATKTALGTAAYMAPEQFKSSRQVDHRADIYALGCILYQLVTGSLPYPERNLAQQMLAHATSPIPEMGARVAGVPPALDEVLRHMMAKSADERFGSMAAVKNALGQAVGALSTGAFAPMTGAFTVAPAPAGLTAAQAVATPEPGGMTTIDPPRRSRAPLLIVLALLALGGGAAAIVLTR
jgi:serine/threonine-protein kinase